ncbi:hypothetical protein SC81_22925, partial [Vibrio vulnificus]
IGRGAGGGKGGGVEVRGGLKKKHQRLEQPGAEHQWRQRVGQAALPAGDRVEQRAGQQRQVLHAVGMDSHQPLAETARRVA